MAEKKEKKGFLGKLGRGLASIVVETGGDESPAAEDDDKAPAADADDDVIAKFNAQAASARASPGGTGAATIGTVIDADFPAIYASRNAVGDPRTDQVRAAYDKMSKTMNGAALQTAVGAMIDAFGIDKATMLATVTARNVAIEAVVAEQREAAQFREVERSTHVTTTTEKAAGRIQELRAEIARLETEVATATAEAQKADAADQGRLAALEQKSLQEKAGNDAFTKFLDQK